MEQEKTCEVHGRLLQPMDVPVLYGLVRYDAALREAIRTLFPHANRHVLGGCFFGAIGDNAQTLVCTECREAEFAWNEKHMPQRNKTWPKVTR